MAPSAFEPDHENPFASRLVIAMLHTLLVELSWLRKDPDSSAIFLVLVSMLDEISH